ncbi:serine protease 42 [Octopus vulgaris]|uniref:Serine protease 42 n=1 Tax=Octopus vulgaris TaxID=6645 RepID=A0AA36EX00_OCTVU|nr:serine protease 42 [Octopus vulgaris]
MFEKETTRIESLKREDNKETSYRLKDVCLNFYVTKFMLDVFKKIQDYNKIVAPDLVIFMLSVINHTSSKHELNSTLEAQVVDVCTVSGPFYGNLKNWRVVLAEGNLEVKSGSEVYRKLSKIISHPGYERASNFPNDIAMLQLDEPVNTYDTNIRMACLPPLETTQLFKEKNCWISGWGETRGSGETNGLNELQVDIVPSEACKPMWGRVDISVLDQQVCVGYGDTGACYGDSGGPLMCEVNGTYYLGGVMSWLINNCSARGFPNVFTRVQSYLDWIHGNIDYYHWWRYS